MTSSPFSISTVAIRRHIATIMLTLAIVVLGVFSLFSLPVDLLPSITYPRIGAGLLARVRFPTNGPPTVVVPTSAIQNESKLFVITGPDDRPVLERRSVQIGQKKGDKVEILAGLDPQERYVARSSRPLKPDSQIRLSILSQSPSP